MHMMTLHLLQSTSQNGVVEVLGGAVVQDLRRLFLFVSENHVN